MSTSISTMSYTSEPLNAGENERLKVKFKRTSSSQISKYYAKVYTKKKGDRSYSYCEKVYFTLYKGRTSKSVYFDVKFSESGKYYTKVKLYTSNGGYITSRIGKYTDTVAGSTNEKITIGSMYYKNDQLVVDETARLKVKFKRDSTSGSSSYTAKVYTIDSSGNSKFETKETKETIRFSSGESSTYEIFTFKPSKAGKIYTKVKVYSGSECVVSRKGQSPDTVKAGNVSGDSWSIKINLPENRDEKGTLKFYIDGTKTFSCECLGRGSDCSDHTNWWTTNADTPTGEYKGALISASSNTSSYGPYKRISIDSSGNGDHADIACVPNGKRDLFRIHGGKPASSSSLTWYPLRPTHGCIRVSNDNQKTLADLVAQVGGSGTVTVSGAQKEKS